MAARRRRRRGGQWAIVIALLIVAIGLWWMSTRRAEAPAPPANVPGARAIGEPPHTEDIAPDEKRELERILRERGAGEGAAKP